MKCPCCGYDDKKRYTPSAEIQRLIALRTKSTRDILAFVSKKIKEYIPSEKLLYKRFLFLQRISKIPDDVVSRGCNDYLRQKIYLKTKGYQYLAGIIENRNKNKAKRIELERKILGTSPPVRIIKENTNNDDS